MLKMEYVFVLVLTVFGADTDVMAYEYRIRQTSSPYFASRRST